MQDRKNYWMSAAVGSNPFARTSGLTQPADQVHSVSGFYGNIDFEQESCRTDFRKTQGTDLNIKNPYVTTQLSVSNFSEIAKRVVTASRFQSAANGLRALRVFLKRVDHKNDGLIHPTDFKFSLKAWGCEITEEEMACLLKYFDTQHTGMISVDQFLHAISSNSLNEHRRQLVGAAYKKLDRNGNQTVSIEDLEANYDVTPNPQYQEGSKSEQELVSEFVGAWDTKQRDACITLCDFIDYYKDVSACIASDVAFENMIRNTWNL